MSIFFKKKKVEDVLNYPWERYYDKDSRTVEVPNISIYDYFEKASLDYKKLTAINYFGVKITFEEFKKRVDQCARAMISQGIRVGDVVTICMPNTPEAVIAFYATNKIGAIANMVHPLSSSEEIKNSIINTKSVLLILINVSYNKVIDFIDETNIYKTIICSPSISMPSLLSIGYQLTKEWGLNIPDDSENVMTWEKFVLRGNNFKCEFPIVKREDDALYLHSGGTTGIPKNIVLTNGNINAIMEQAKIIFPDVGVGDTFLSILPLFHCFGLVVCVCAPLALGAEAVLVPQFDAGRFDKLIRKYKPTILTGVPTLFEALLKNPYMMNLDMSFVRYVISGGDSLSKERNHEVNKFLKNHNSNSHIMQGYGMTETTGPACFGALGSDKLGSVGIPLPGNVVKILDPDTREEKRCGEVGEICVSGPTLMKEYLDNEEATNNMIFKDEEGTRWVHTGDLGYMDEDGVLFFVQRLKRMLIVSGYNVYPSHIENVLLDHEDIDNCGVIGVPHPYKVQVPKAYIVLKKGVEASEEEKLKIRKYLEKNLSKYMLPKEIVFRESLPKTMIGKVNYRELEKENEKDK